MVSEVLHGQFDDAGECHYPLVDKRPDRQPRTRNEVPPLRPLTVRDIIDKLPRTARARYYDNWGGGGGCRAE